RLRTTAGAACLSVGKDDAKVGGSVKAVGGISFVASEGEDSIPGEILPTVSVAAAAMAFSGAIKFALDLGEDSLDAARDLSLDVAGLDEEKAVIFSIGVNEASKPAAFTGVNSSATRGIAT
ncbi:MAG: hypothetical protein WCL29_05690, partial [Pseudomonadota bacterium]